MRLSTVCVATPQTYDYDGRKVSSSIFKQPVTGPIAVGELGLAGNRQANLNVHGGTHKAVYAYSADRYAGWSEKLTRDDLEHGMFGENLTIAGLDEAQVLLGDQWDIGDARFEVTGPRIPCANLAMRFDNKTMPRQFTESGCPGVYLRVLRAGAVQAGDVVTTVTHGSGPAIKDLFQAYSRPSGTEALNTLQAALNCDAIDPEFADGVAKRVRNR